MCFRWCLLSSFLFCLNCKGKHASFYRSKRISPHRIKPPVTLGVYRMKSEVSSLSCTFLFIWLTITPIHRPHGLYSLTLAFMSKITSPPTSVGLWRPESMALHVMYVVGGHVSSLTGFDLTAHSRVRPTCPGGGELLEGRDPLPPPASHWSCWPRAVAQECSPDGRH